ncbi:MAG: acetyl-CoA carboxylase biotin carboxyl carrier protein subunit [Clostridiales bacterium]|nr:acetyl-CoA carboxylase biotin carboxyl carrier protein subunit [Clostridiales bacterium]
MKNYNVTVNGVTYEVSVEETGGSIVSSTPAPVAAPAVSAAPAPVKAAPAPAAGNGEPVKAPMPGTILRMNVKVGDKIEKDSLVCVLEAMKMENEIFSPVAGTVTAIAAPQGASVATGDTIVTVA